MGECELVVSQLLMWQSQIEKELVAFCRENHLKMGLIILKKHITIGAIYSLLKWIIISQ